MIKAMASHCGDDTCPSCVVAGDYIFLAHHAGGHQSDEITTQMEASFNSMQQTLSSVGACLDDLVQINLYLRDISDFPAAREVFSKYFTERFPARMTSTTQFVSPKCLCMLDGVAYKPQRINTDATTD